MTIVLVSINDDDKVPRTNAVRGYMNSILILEKKNADKTLCTLLIEVGPRGWLYPLSGIVSMILTSRITNYMTNFKQLFEKDKESYAMSVDEIARKRFEKIQKDKYKETNIIDDDGVNNKDDLKVTIRMLENKLVQISNTERKDKIDLTDLKERVRNDLNAAKNKLARLK